MKKFIAMALALVLVASLSIGGTLAYLSDSDAQVNTFTNGNVYIDLWEDFGDNDEEGIEKLLPAVGSAQDGTLKNGVEKEVYVTNTGSELAYVRVHIAIPALLDGGNNASENILHFNYAPESVGAEYWDWSNTAGAPYTGEWNTTSITVDGINYTVYTVTYGKALAPNETTVDAMSQVYLDSSVTNETITELNNALGQEWKIYVCAEAAQADGFEDAYTALNTVFGNGAADVDWTAVTGGTVNTKWVESDTVKSIPIIINEDITTTSTGYGYYVEYGSTTTFNNVNVTTEGGGLDVRGTAVLNGGSVTTNSTSTSGRHVFYVAAREGEADGHLTINGGVFKFSPSNLTRKGSFIYADGGTVIVNGGTFHKPSTRDGHNPITVANGGSVTIYGGTFAFDPSIFVAEGYQAVESDGWWTVAAE